MGSGSEPHDLGTRVLGPHVVGRRVVVRRVVPGEFGPTGGPALTDVLGVCVSWTDDACVVQPESGPPITIPLGLIVSGKPVPPRPSVRQRVSVRDAESHVLSLFPGIEVEPLGDWLLRNDPAPIGRPRRRANSCLAMGDPGLPFTDADRAIREFYAARARPVLAQVEVGSPVESEFVNSGWRPLGDGDAHFQLASLARVRRALRARAPEPLACSLEVDGDRARAVLVQEGEVIAEGSVALDGDWLGLHDVSVAPSHRRRGFAHGVLDTLMDWGAERGAVTAWLHVETDNAPGLALYESLGFGTHHTCRYLTPAP